MEPVKTEVPWPLLFCTNAASGKYVPDANLDIMKAPFAVSEKPDQKISAQRGQRKNKTSIINQKNELA
jgi:hypothetical protein